MAAVVPIGPACPRCAGGGEVNGTVCPECEGSSRLTPAKRRRWRRRLLRVADAAAVPAGTVVGWSLGSLSSLPGVLGAAGFTWGLADVVHSLVHQVPEVGAAVLVAGVFALLLDRQL